MWYPWAVVWDDVVAKIWQLRRRFLGRSGEGHVRYRSTKDAHKHVAYPPQYKGYGHFQVGQGQVIVLDVHGRLVGALLEFGQPRMTTTIALFVVLIWFVVVTGK